MVVPLDDLQEERGSVLHGLGEDLEEVATIVVVNQNVQLLQLRGISLSDGLCTVYYTMFCTRKHTLYHL